MDRKRGLYLDSSDKELVEISKIHCKAFTKSLMVLLGQDFVKKSFSWYIESPNGFLLINREGKKINGYCGGIINNGNLPYGSASSLAQHSFDAAVLAFIKRPWLLFHPEMFKKYKFVLRNVWYRIFPAKISNKGSTGYSQPHTGLVVIGVDPSSQGQGIGQKLLSQFESRTIELGIDLMRLSVHSSNEKAIKAYKRSGWGICQDNRDTLVMEKRLS